MHITVRALENVCSKTQNQVIITWYLPGFFTMLSTKSSGSIPGKDFGIYKISQQYWAFLHVKIISFANSHIQSQNEMRCYGFGCSLFFIFASVKPESQNETEVQALGSPNE